MFTRKRKKYLHISLFSPLNKITEQGYVDQKGKEQHNNEIVEKGHDMTVKL